MVPHLGGERFLPASHPGMGRHGEPLPTHQGSPKVRLAAGHFGHVYQQVSPSVIKMFPNQISLTNIEFLMLFFSIGGLILKKTVSDPDFEGMAVFTTVINGKLKNS